MSTENQKTLGERATDLAISEAKSAAFWYAVSNIGKVFALLATLGGGVAIMSDSSNIVGSTISNTNNAAGAGEFACMTKSGIIRSSDPRKLKGCKATPQFLTYR